jgi:hypothetical protein
LWAFRIARFVPAPLFLRAGIIYRLLRRSLYTRCLLFLLQFMEADLQVKLEQSDMV